MNLMSSSEQICGLLPDQGFPIVGVAWGTLPHPTIFFEPPPPSKLMPPMGHPPPHLKMKLSPSEKQPPPPLKCEVPFHEMIPRKSTLNNNLKSS